MLFRDYFPIHAPRLRIGLYALDPGCPEPPQTIDTLLATITAHIPMPLSVKIRLGRQDKEEIHGLIQVLNRHPLDHVILHPRTGIQMYRGAADHDAFEAAMEASIHPFVYNGDITDTATFSTVKHRFPGMLAGPRGAARARLSARGARSPGFPLLRERGTIPSVCSLDVSKRISPAPLP